MHQQALASAPAFVDVDGSSNFRDWLGEHEQMGGEPLFRTGSLESSSDSGDQYTSPYFWTSYEDDAMDGMAGSDATTLEQLVALQASLHDVSHHAKFSSRTASAPLLPKHYKASTKVNE
jgi:hypothetical protein